MKPLAFLLAITLVLAFGLASPGLVQGADAVGHFTQVEGRVEILKGGQLPATPVKVQDPVEKGDVIRTKSLSRAQVTFIDNSTVTFSPESRVAIDEYIFEPEKGKRNAVLQLFQGMALTVVTKIFKAEQPDFVIKTHTAVMGIRGTEVGIRLQPNSSTFMDFSGKTCVNSNYAEVKGEVCLSPMQATMVDRGLPPTLPFEITNEDKNMFMRQMTACPPSQKNICAGQGAMASSGSGAGGGTTLGGSVAPSGGNIADNPTGPLFVPPTSAPPPAPTPQVSNFTFNETYTGNYQLSSVSPFSVATYTNTSPGNGTRTGVYPASFTANYAITATSPQVNTFSPFNTGTFSMTSNANVSGILGNTLNGIMNMLATTSGGTSFNFSGPVSLQPNGNLAYQTNGTFTLGNITGVTSGTWTQQNK